VFTALGRFDYRHRRSLPLVMLGLAVAAVALSTAFGGQLSPGGFTIPGSNSARAEALLAQAFGSGRTSLVVVYVSPRPDAADPPVEHQITHSLRRLRGYGPVSSILTYASTGDHTFLGDRGRASFAVVNLSISENQAISRLGAIEARIGHPQGLRTLITGAPPVDALYNSTLQRDLTRTEAITLPISLVLLLFVFGSLVAAALPLLTAGLALPTALAIVSLLAAHLQMSIFVTNVATIIGLGLAIDYALFLVRRFREEMAGGDVERALERTMASAGKAIAISGTAVAIGLSSLMLFPAPGLRSMGIGGVVVACCTLLFGLTALPAVLALLGPRVNRLRVGWPRRRGLVPSGPHRRRPVPAGGPGRGQAGFWAGVARLVMRHPLPIVVPAVALLLVVGTPFLSLRLSTGGSVADIPPGPPRAGFALLTRDFPSAGGGDVLNPVVAYPTPGLTPTRERQLAAYVQRLRRVPGVTSVQSVLAPPPHVTRAAYLRWLRLPADRRPHRVTSYIAAFLAGRVTQLQVGNNANANAPAGNRLVLRVRAVRPPPDARTYVTGGAADAVDFTQAFQRTVPVAVAVVMGVTALVLLLTFGSLLLPLQAVMMSLLSLSAAFGALVWIFQQGHLARLLGFTPAGSIVATDPVLMFAIVFGLSMDYEVFLLSRIRERYVATGDTRRAVAEGLGATGGLITSAALIMITVFGAFALSNILELKALGLGMALAVAVDATLVRGVLVPAVMRLLGPANWWAPPRLQGWVERLGFYEPPASESEPGRSEAVG